MTLHMRTAPELQRLRPSTPPPLPRPQLAPGPLVARSAAGRFALAMSVLGAGVGATALAVALTTPAVPSPVHPAPPPVPVYSEAQVAAAKTKACAAWKLSSDGLIANTNRGAHPTGTDDALGWANMANGRAAYLLAALWLPTQVYPATPPDLKDAVNLFASTAGNSAALSINEDKNNGHHEQFMKNLDTLNAARLKIEQLCQ